LIDVLKSAAQSTDCADPATAPNVS